MLVEILRACYRGTSESDPGGGQSWGKADNGATRPVHARIDPLQHGTAEEDIDPGIENLVPSSETNVDE